MNKIKVIELLNTLIEKIKTEDDNKIIPYIEGIIAGINSHVEYTDYLIPKKFDQDYLKNPLRPSLIDPYMPSTNPATDHLDIKWQNPTCETKQSNVGPTDEVNFNK